MSEHDSSSNTVRLLHHQGALTACWLSDSGQDQRFSIDFASGSAGYRAQRSQHELIVRAIQGKQKHTKRVIDCTAGLGRDAFILASHGFEVLMLERNPIIADLLEDAMRRAALVPELTERVDRMRLIRADAAEWLGEQRMRSLNEFDALDVVLYCDPMFPPRNKHAKAKKEMQFFQRLLGHKTESDEKLLQTVLQGAHQRTVIKRPVSAAPVVRQPTYQLTGRAIRFDVYVMPS